MPAKKKSEEPTTVKNESDVDLYYPTLGVTLAPGETYKPKSEE